MTKLAIALIIGLSAEQSFAITKKAPATLSQSSSTVEFVTTSVVSRAMVDVQIRRIKNLLTSTSIEEADAAFEKLEQLQNDLNSRR